MAKKKNTSEVPETEVGTSVAVIIPEFERLPAFKLATLDSSLKIITDKATEYGKLTITDTKDKDGYDKVVAARGEMKKSRIAYINSAYENFVDPLKKDLKSFEADLEKIENAFKAVEKDLQEKQDFIDSEKKRLKAEEEAAKVRAMHVRVNDLNVLGAMFDGAVYTFGYADTLMITSGDIKDQTDEEFGEFLEEVKTSWTVEQDRIKQEEEDAMLLQEQQEEENERNRQLALKNQQEAKQLTEKRTNLRLKELKLMGAKFNTDTGDAVLIDYHNQQVLRDVIETMPDELWDELMTSIQEYEPEPEVSVGETTEGATFKPDSHFTQGMHPDTEPADIITEVDFDEIPMQSVTHLLNFGSFEHGTEPLYKEIPISAKFIVRIFPVEFEGIATDGCAVINEGELQQGLKWAVIRL